MLPPVPLFGSLAYELHPRSFKSWWWRFTSWCLFTPRQKKREKKRQLIRDHIKGPLVATFSSPLMKALDRSVKTLGLWIVTSSVTFIKSVNQSSIKPCLIVHLVAMWTLIHSVSTNCLLCSYYLHCTITIFSTQCSKPFWKKI